jgi:hypothetical protein
MTVWAIAGAVAPAAVLSVTPRSSSCWNTGASVPAKPVWSQVRFGQRMTDPMNNLVRSGQVSGVNIAIVTWSRSPGVRCSSPTSRTTWIVGSIDTITSPCSSQN